MSAHDELFWPSLYSRLAPSRYRPIEEVDAEEELSAGDADAASFGLSRYFVDFNTLRAHVEIELQSLLNSTCMEAALVGSMARGGPPESVRTEDHPFEGHPGVRTSIVNYGLPAFIGRNVYGMPIAMIEGRLRRAVESFEPRIRPETMRVSVQSTNGDKIKGDQPLQFVIEGEIMGADQSLSIVINTVWDPEKVRTDVSRVEIGR
jgi:predicted component of type VI protein secretion system